MQQGLHAAGLPSAVISANVSGSNNNSSSNNNSNNNNNNNAQASSAGGGNVSPQLLRRSWESRESYASDGDSGVGPDSNSSR